MSILDESMTSTECVCSLGHRHTIRVPACPSEIRHPFLDTIPDYPSKTLRCIKPAGHDEDDHWNAYDFDQAVRWREELPRKSPSVGRWCGSVRA
jgi:hypothetical protein